MTPNTCQFESYAILEKHELAKMAAILDAILDSGKCIKIQACHPNFSDAS